VRAVGILLAGGFARRFGSDKLLHRLQDGTPIALASLRNLRSVLPRVVAVVRPDAGELARLLEDGGAEVTVCERSAEGMGATLAHAVRHAGNAPGYVVALADMPFILAATVARIVSRIEEGALLVAPRFAGKRGHPVGFASSFYDQLAALGGDEGARTLLERHVAAIELIDTDDPGVLRDIDTPGDLD
jgi:molybdenum cofactor cytidylyltransferase